MPTTAEVQNVALQLHAVLSEIDPLRWRDERVQGLRERLADLHAQRHVLPRPTAQPSVAEVLESELPRLETADSELKRRWMAFRERLQPAYQALAAELKARSIHLPSLRPANYSRNLLHVSSAIFAVGCITQLPTVGVIGVALAWAVFAWTCEASRRLSPGVNSLLMRFFSPVAHPHEALKVNSATWYATALVLLSLTGSSALCLLGVVVLGVGDPCAAIIGKRFGRRRFASGRSVEGSVAFAVSAAVATFGVLLAVPGSALGVGTALAVALGGAVAGALVELASRRVDDNFSIPLGAAAGGALVLWALGLPTS